MRPYTTEQLRELSTAVGPQWQGEVRAALRYCADLIDAANAVIAQPVQPEQEKPFEIGKRVAQEGRGISDLWGAVANDSDLPEAQRGYEDALAQPEQAEHFGVEEPGESHHPGYYFTDRNK
jgi:hypothetical protein